MVHSKDGDSITYTSIVILYVEPVLLAYTSLALALESDICTLENQLYVQNYFVLHLEYCLYLATLLSYAFLLAYIYPLEKKKNTRNDNVINESREN